MNKVDNRVIACFTAAALVLGLLALALATPRDRFPIDPNRVVVTSSQCTAFPVAPRAYLTAGHCLPVERVGDEDVVEVHEHPSLDVALLITADDRAPWTRNAPRALRLAQDDAEPGDRIYVVGYAYGRYRLPVQGWKGDENNASAPIVGGYSGSPIMDSYGGVVGVVTQAYTYGGSTSHVMRYVPVTEFREWLLPLLSGL